MFGGLENLVDLVWGYSSSTVVVLRAILSNQGGNLETLFRVHTTTSGLWGSCLIKGGKL